MRVSSVPGSGPTSQVSWPGTRFGACLNRNGFRPSGTVSSRPTFRTWSGLWFRSISVMSREDWRSRRHWWPCSERPASIRASSPSSPEPLLTPLRHYHTGSLRGDGSGRRWTSRKAGWCRSPAWRGFTRWRTGSPISATLDRLVAAEGLGAINKETAQSLREAFTLSARSGSSTKLEQIRAGSQPNNLIRPEELLPLARAELREAFNAIGRAQQELYRFVPPGI